MQFFEKFTNLYHHNLTLLVSSLLSMFFYNFLKANFVKQEQFW